MTYISYAFSRLYLFTGTVFAKISLGRVDTAWLKTLLFDLKNALSTKYLTLLVPKCGFLAAKVA